LLVIFAKVLSLGWPIAPVFGYTPHDLPQIRWCMMARKKPVDSEFVLFDVIYEDGSQSSNRKIASAEIDPYDKEGSARAIIEAQDRKIAEMSGRPRGPVKSMKRSAVR
jgi:hypothetical protein